MIEANESSTSLSRGNSRTVTELVSLLSSPLGAVSYLEPSTSLHVQRRESGSAGDPGVHYGPVLPGGGFSISSRFGPSSPQLQAQPHRTALSRSAAVVTSSTPLSAGRQSCSSLTASTDRMPRERRSQTEGPVFAPGENTRFAANISGSGNAQRSTLQHLLSQIEAPGPRNMQTLPVSSASNDDDVECCSVCTESRRYLKILPCRHCFCEYCLQQIVNRHTDTTSVGHFPCPLCRATITIPERGASDFPIHTAGSAPALCLDEVAPTLRAMTEQKGSGRCEECGIEDRRYTCVQCQKAVCNVCCHNHRSHPLLLLPSLCSLAQDSGQDRCQYNSHCSSELRYFCSPCGELLCETCWKGAHAKHKVQSLSQAASAARQCLNQTQLRVERGLRFLQVTQEHSTKEERLTLQGINKTERTIRSRAAEARAFVDQCEKAALTSLYDTRNTLRKTLAVKQNTVQDRIAALTAIVSNMERVLHSGSETELVRMQVSAQDSIGTDGFLHKYTGDLPCHQYNVELKHETYAHFTEVVKQWVGAPSVIPKQIAATVVRVVAEVPLVNNAKLCVTVLSVCPVGDQHVWMTYQQDIRAPTFTVIALCNLDTGHMSRTSHVEGLVSLVKLDQGLALAKLENCQTILVLEGTHEMLPHVHRYNRVLFAKRQLRACLRMKKDRQNPHHLHTELIVDVNTPEDIFNPRSPKRDVIILDGLHDPRLMDMSSDGQWFAIVDKNHDMHVIRRDARRAHMIVSVEDNSKLLQSISDVCFYTLGEREVLLVADPSQSDVLVLDVFKQPCCLLGFLTNMSGRLQYPSALNVDSTKGLLVVACRGSSIVLCGDTGVPMGNDTRFDLACRRAK